MCPSRRVLPPAFPQMRLDNTIQVLPAPPFRKIKRNYVADRGTSPAPDGQIFSLSLLRRVLPLAFPQMRLAAAFGYYLRRGRLLFLGHNFSHGAPPSSLKRFYRREKLFSSLYSHRAANVKQIAVEFTRTLRKFRAEKSPCGRFCLKLAKYP